MTCGDVYCPDILIIWCLVCIPELKENPSSITPFSPSLYDPEIQQSWQQMAAEVFHRWFTAAFRGNDWHPDRRPQRRDERPFLTENTGVTNYINSSQVCKCQGPARWPTSLHLNGMEPSLISLVTPVLFLLFQVKHLLWYRLQLGWITTFTTLSHQTNIVVFIVIHSDYKGSN